MFFKGKKEKRNQVRRNEKSAYVKYRAANIVKLLILVALIIGIPLYLYFFQRDLLHTMRNLEDAKVFLRERGSKAIIAYFVIQIVQVIISIIPGNILQIAAGYVFGFRVGFVASIAGVMLGSVVTFHLGRFLGKDGMEMMIGKERFDKFIRKCNSKRGFIVIFLLNLIPGGPKDLLCYVAGVSNMRFTVFITVVMAARIPAMSASILFGKLIDAKNYTGVAVMAVVVAIFMLLIFLRHDELNEKLDKLYVKYVLKEEE